MIYCFSGTGNSQWVADHLQEFANDDEVYGLVFPVHAWGVPKVVENEIIGNSRSMAHNPKIKYVFAVMTCGDDTGYADTVLRNLLGGRLDAVFSIQMPNTYVCLPGFDTDSDELARGKVEGARQRLPQIADCIRRKEHKTEVVRGTAPWLKTYVLRPLFNRFLVTDKYFHTTGHCTACQQCVKQCPLKNISMGDDRQIHWGETYCTGCLRCYHRCPNNAIRFGWFTKGKGQKHNF